MEKMRLMCYSKIHRGVVTDANLNYEGSLTLDTDFLEKSDMLPYEKVLVVNINNGKRFETYIIPGKKGSKEICLNGAAARLGEIGDRIIVMNFTWLNEQEAHNFKPKIIILDEKNNVIKSE